MIIASGIRKVTVQTKGSINACFFRNGSVKRYSNACYSHIDPEALLCYYSSIFGAGCDARESKARFSTWA
ncbi:MAG: hypothetical protein DRG87_03560 [Deltaproteobacteria bacterium]|nr:MAG: hypothetical protein DRG87_03560 [Deltaproteobacteria bacterium]